MTKKKKPVRERALELFLKHNGDITNRAIAKKLDANEKTVSVWKYRYKWKEKLKCSTKPKKQSTTKEKSIREIQRDKIIDALNIANSYSPALNILIEVYLDCFEEYENAKKNQLETESLRKELARLLRDLGLDISNRNMLQKRIDSKGDTKDEETANKLLKFRKRMST